MMMGLLGNLSSCAEQRCGISAGSFMLRTASRDKPQGYHLAVLEVCLSRRVSFSLQLQAALPALPMGHGPRAEELRQRISEKHQQMHGFTSAEDELRDARKEMEENLRELKGALHARSGCPRAVCFGVDGDEPALGGTS